MTPTFNITFRMEVPTVPKGGIESIDMSLRGALMPFVPSPTMMVMPIAGDDYRKVEEVYWSQAGGVVVYFEFASKATRGAIAAQLKHLKKLGWKEDAP